MLNLKTWLSNLNLPVAAESFYTAPPLPYLLYLEQSTTRGSDSNNKLIDRTITLELYTEKITPGTEASIEALLNGIPVEFSKDRMWLSSEKMYETIYTFSLTEKL